MHDLIVFGLPGSGKGTQARLISQKYSAEIISTGDLLRSISDGGLSHSDQVFSAIKDGKLVGDDLVCSIVSDKILSIPTGVSVVFDGFPRNLAQASFLSSTKRDITIVIELVVDEGSVVRRLGGRLLCSDCLAVNNSGFGSFGGICQYCGSSNLVVRTDDSDFAVIRKRIDEYQLQSSILFEYYKSKMVRIDGSCSIEEVWADIQNKIDLFV